MLDTFGRDNLRRQCFRIITQIAFYVCVYRLVTSTSRPPVLTLLLHSPLVQDTPRTTFWAILFVSNPYMLCIVTPLHLSLPCSLIYARKLLFAQVRGLSEGIRKSRLQRQIIEDHLKTAQISCIVHLKWGDVFWCIFVFYLFVLKKKCEFMYVDSLINQVHYCIAL